MKSHYVYAIYDRDEQMTFFTSEELLFQAFNEEHGPGHHRKYVGPSYSPIIDSRGFDTGFSIEMIFVQGDDE